MNAAMVTRAELGRLLRMAAALEETIQALEDEEDGTDETIRRLRSLQGEILATARLLEGDFPLAG
jgi:hypothetical protein